MGRVALGLVGLLLVGWGLTGGAPRAVADDLDISFFYDSLAPYGDWVDLDPYGTVWVPGQVPPDWRPYMAGDWEYTDDYGWVFDSDEPWAWAVYHYGRWIHDPYYGWCWVPGYEWGPAWVAWRSGGGYLGWYPLPPYVDWDWDSGFVIGGAVVDWDDLELGIGADDWIFCRERDFDRDDLRHRIFGRDRDRELFRRTKNSTHFDHVEHRLVNGSVDPVHLGKLTGHPIPHLHVQPISTLPTGPKPTDHVLRLFNPNISKLAPKGTPPPPKFALPPHPPVAITVKPGVISTLVPHGGGTLPGNLEKGITNPKPPPEVQVAPPLVPPKVPVLPPTPLHVNNQLELQQQHTLQLQQLRANQLQNEQQLLEKHRLQLLNPPANTYLEDLQHQQELERRQLELQHHTEQQNMIHQQTQELHNYNFNAAPQQEFHAPPVMEHGGGEQSGGEQGGGERERRR